MTRACKATALNTFDKYYLREMKNLVAEVHWRGLVHAMMPGTE